MTYEAQRAAEKLAELILSHGEKTEATAVPYWYVAIKASTIGGGGKVKQVSDGIWFNREAAEDHLRERAYRYPKAAFVYCGSGHDSWHMKQAYDLAKEVLEDSEPERSLRPGDLGYRMKPKAEEPS